MRPHRGVAPLHMLGQREVDLWRLAALFAETFEGETHGVRMRHIALQRLEDGRLQIGGAVAVQQSDQGGSDGAQIGAPFRGAREQSLAGGDGVGEAVSCAVLASGVLLLDQGLDMGGGLDLRVFVVAAPVNGEHFGAIEQCEPRADRQAPTARA